MYCLLYTSILCYLTDFHTCFLLDFETTKYDSDSMFNCTILTGAFCGSPRTKWKCRAGISWNLTMYRARKSPNVIRIRGQNPRKNVPPIVRSSLALGINPWVTKYVLLSEMMGMENICIISTNTELLNTSMVLAPKARFNLKA